MARVIRQLDDEALERPFNKDQFFRLLQYMKPYKKQVLLSLLLLEPLLHDAREHNMSSAKLVFRHFRIEFILSPPFFFDYTLPDC